MTGDARLRRNQAARPAALALATSLRRPVKRSVAHHNLRIHAVTRQIDLRSAWISFTQVIDLK